MDNTPIVIVDTQGIILFWSPAAQAVFGYAVAGSIGQTLDLIVPEEHRQAHWKGFRRAVACGQAAVEGQVNPFPVRKADGEIITMPGRLSMLRQASGQVIALMVVFG